MTIGGCVGAGLPRPYEEPLAVTFWVNLRPVVLGKPKRLRVRTSLS